MMYYAIDPVTFHRALLQGARCVENRREELNRINAFPVPDRDTGNNLAFLMAQLRRQLPTPNAFPDLLMRLSEASLLGARGNSGVIFSQYFNGFRLAGLSGIDLNNLPFAALADLLEQGYTCAYHAIQQPKDGTILTAMRSLAEHFRAVSGQLVNWAEVAEGVLTRLRATVLNTVNVLPQQRAQGSPDAGAMGFYSSRRGFYARCCAAGWRTRRRRTRGCCLNCRSVYRIIPHRRMFPINIAPRWWCACTITCPPR